MVITISIQTVYSDINTVMDSIITHAEIEGWDINSIDGETMPDDDTEEEE